MIEQRECARVAAEYPAELRAHGELNWWQGNVSDIGEKGVRLCTLGGPNLEPGTGVWLRIQPKESHSKLVVRGSVVRCGATTHPDFVEVACQFA